MKVFQMRVLGNFTVLIIVSILGWLLISRLTIPIKEKVNSIEVGLLVQDGFNRAGIMTYEELQVSLSVFENLLFERGFISDDLQSLVALEKDFNLADDQIPWEDLMTVPRHNDLYSPTLISSYVLAVRHATKNYVEYEPINKQVQYYIDVSDDFDLSVLAVGDKALEAEFVRIFCLLSIFNEMVNNNPS